MPTYRDQGIVLRIRPARDADRHYTIYTAEHGKINVLAKGTRRGGSKLSPHLGSFGIVEIMVARGRLIDRLAGANLARRFTGVPASLAKTAAAQSFLMTVDTLTKRELPEDRIFRLLTDFFESLDRWNEEPGCRNPIYDGAALKLLDILGFAPEIDVCVRCRRVLPSAGGAMNVWRGGIECASCRPAAKSALPSDAVTALRLLRSEPLSSVKLSALDRGARSQAGDIIESLLTGHLEEGIRALHYLRQLA